jgi:hypothetical protein
MEHILIVYEGNYSESISVQIEDGEIICLIHQSEGPSGVKEHAFPVCGAPALTLRVTKDQFDLMFIMEDSVTYVPPGLREQHKELQE